MLAGLNLGGCKEKEPWLEIETERFEAPFSPGGSLVVRNPDGAIRVYGGGEPTIVVEAQKHAFTRERARSLGVKFSNSEGKAVVETVPPPPKPWWSFADRSGSVHYTIIVPQGTSLPELTLKQGDFHVVGMTGDALKARIGHGRAIVQNCFTDVDIEVQFGRLELLFSWWKSGAMTIRGLNHHGVLRTTLPPDASFRVRADSPGGRVRNAFAPKRDDRVTPLELSFERGEEPQTELWLRSGTADILIERSY